MREFRLLRGSGLISGQKPLPQGNYTYAARFWLGGGDEIEVFSYAGSGIRGKNAGGQAPGLSRYIKDWAEVLFSDKV